MKHKIEKGSLYLVISEEYCNGRPPLEVAGTAISGGVDILQMREKNKTAAELAKLGGGLARLCREKGVMFIVNDDPFLAKKVGADGVHLGQDDLKRYTADEARKIAGDDAIVGISTHSMEEFAAANSSAADYIAFGPIFPTKTKDYSIGTKDVDKILKGAKKEVFLIGGINLSNMGGLLALGARNVALIRGITEADDIVSRTAEFKKKIGK